MGSQGGRSGELGQGRPRELNSRDYGHQKAEPMCPGAGAEGRRAKEKEGGRVDQGWVGRSLGGEVFIGESSTPSGSVLQDWAHERQAPELGRGAGLRPAGLPLPAGGEAGWQVPGGRVTGRKASGGLAATEEAHWKVLNMGGPLGCQLEELDVTPLDAINGHWG